MNLEHLILRMQEKKASSMHMSAGLPPLFNINGRLLPDSPEKIEEEQIENMAFGLMNSFQQEKFKTEHSINFTLEIGALGRQRISFYRQKGCVNALFSPIPDSIPSVSELGLPRIIENFAAFRSGLVIICGPAGCGKSTTVASILARINEKRCAHVVTLEEPIEYLFPSRKALFSQREIGRDTYSYTRALTECIRQDADIILVSDLSDSETIKTALLAAETGVLVFATMHTTDSVQTINRIISAFSSAQQQQVRTQLSLVLKAIVSQQLVMRADGSGRVAAAEIMFSNTAIRNLIRESRTHQIYSNIENGSETGMQTMDQSLQQLYENKVITDIELLTNANKPDEVQKKIQKNEIPTTQTTNDLASVDIGEQMITLDKKMILYKASFLPGQEGYWTSSVGIVFQEPGLVIRVAPGLIPKRLYVSDFNIVSKKLRPFTLGKKLLVRFKIEADKSRVPQNEQMMMNIKLFAQNDEQSSAGYDKINLDYPINDDGKWHTYVIPLPYEAVGKMLKINMLEFPICLTKIFISDIIFF